MQELWTSRGRRENAQIAATLGLLGMVQRTIVDADAHPATKRKLA